MRVATAVFASLLLADFAGSVRTVKRRSTTKAKVEAGARSSKACELGATDAYFVGDVVLGLYSNGRTYGATVATVIDSRTYKIDWADGDTGERIKNITELCLVKRGGQATGECMNITGMYEWASANGRQFYEYLKQTNCAGLSADGAYSFTVEGSTVYYDGIIGDVRAGPPITIKFTDGFNYTQIQAHATSASPSTDRVEFVGSQFNTANCPVGTRKATRNECLQTPSYYGAPGVYYQDSIYYPGGCYFHASTNAIWWSNLTSGFSARASSQPICVPNSESQGGGMTGNDFIMWMQLNNVHAGGWACGYKDGWCGCSCGNNYAAPCSNPPMTAGTEGGRTCGWFGNLYGCAEAHNTVENCPAMR